MIEELQVFEPDVVIKDLKVMGGGLAGRKSLGRLAVMSNGELRSVAVQRCDRATNCADCVALQDPYCAWDVRASRCSSGGRIFLKVYLFIILTTFSTLFTFEFHEFLLQIGPQIWRKVFSKV